MFNWNEIITDAVSRLDWVAGQSSDPAVQSMLLQTAGAGEPVANSPLPDTVRAERRKAITRERMARLLGHRRDNRWAGRETGKGSGPFDPATITAEQATALLVVVRRYVARWAHPTARYPLSQEGQDDTVSRIINAIWTRDYTRSNVTAGNLAGATWQACAMYRKTAWVGESALERKEARRGKRCEAMPDDLLSPRRGGIDNPARIFWAIEAAAEGLSAPAVVNRGRKQTRRQRGYKRMEPVSVADARAVLCGE
jgi:hypothetical protein